MAKHNETGVKGESLAAEMLLQKGYAILFRNWRYGHKEVDIVAAKGELLVFVEVKTRSGTGMGFPEEAVSQRKIRFLQEAALVFLESHPEFQELRFDVVTYLFRGDEVLEMQHLEDVGF